ncbi:MAG: adenylate/guanylate cyclase domain-containing protein [Hyphomicrobiaceae bacterium]
MAKQRPQRRLAAILAADVVGYSRLMQADEAATIAALKSRRREILEPLVARHAGRIFKMTGDGVLIEFSSAVDATQCAVALQAAMASANEAEPENRQIVLRIGINLGDVVVEGGDLYGDGINIAARLEAIAGAGNILMSAGAHEHIKNKLKLGFDDLGPQRLKNIAEPVRAYRVTGLPPVASTLGQPALDKPSIAVLPFTNMSGPEQEYFSDGISEDIITELSKFHSLFVVSRHSSFAFKGQAMTATDASRKLRARYVVEGSVRRAGDRLRITAQLIDGADDAHLWAERYDRELDDIFDVQDEVVRAIVTAIEPKLLSSERNRALRKPPDSLDAWESYQRGLWHAYQYKPEDRERTLSFFHRAIELDPRFASAYAGLGYALYTYIILGASTDRGDDVDRVLEASKTAVQLDERDPFGWLALNRAHLLRVEHDAAIAAADTAIALNPNFAAAHFGRAHALWHSGRPGEAIASHDEAIRLSPFDPLMWSYLASKAIALVLLGRSEEAIATSRRSQQQATSAIFSHLAEISALGQLGRIGDAHDAIRRARQNKADVSIAYVDQTLPITDPRCRDVFLGGLRKAGLPE